MSAEETRGSPDRWSLRTAIASRDGYLVLLILTVAQLAIWLLVLEGNAIVHVLAYWLLLVTIIVAMHRAQVHALAFRVIAGALLLVGLTWSVLVGFTGNPNADETSLTVGISALTYAALLAMTFPLIVRRAFAHRIVSIDTICALLTAYLFIGLFFAGTIRAIGGFGVRFYVEATPNNSENAVYFAFECLTTLGMGDLTPMTGLPRMVAILCALAGQLFLVTAVARTVSLFGEERRRDLPA